jgi:heme/copper-type cytochrome/quinol oxidase subunit 2
MKLLPLHDKYCSLFLSFHWYKGYALQKTGADTLLEICNVANQTRWVCIIIIIIIIIITVIIIYCIWVFNRWQQSLHKYSQNTQD